MRRFYGWSFAGTIAIPLVLALALVTWLTFDLVYRVSAGANMQDSERTRQIVESAIGAAEKQLENATADNAYWDDAARQVYGDTDENWLRDTWGVPTESGATYDLMLIADRNASSLLSGYRKGEAFEPDVRTYFGQDLAAVLGQFAEAPDESESKATVMRTADGLAIIAAATIMPTSPDLRKPGQPPRYLIFGKYLSHDYLKSLGSQYVIDGLTVTDSRPRSGPFFAITDNAGNDIAFAHWKDRRPGDLALRSILTTSIAVVVFMSLVLAGIGVLCWRLLGHIAERERSALHESLHDSLTGLPNRSGLQDQMRQLIGEGEANLAIAYADLDGFKEVNDYFGHDMGDRLLKAISAGLKQLAGPDNYVSRLGGDEFVVLTKGEHAIEQARRIGDFFIAFVQEPFDLDGRIASVGVSIGIASLPSESRDTTELLRRADLAMYHAKSTGKNRHFTYSAALDNDKRENLEIANELRQHIVNGLLEVAYQPIVSAANLDVVAIEALARWPSSSPRRVTPDKFVAVAEANGLIDDLGQAVLAIACKEVARWETLRLSVNVSPIQLRNPDFARRTIRTLHEHMLPGQRLELEITENVLMSEFPAIMKNVNDLRAAGIRLALDDFGTGYSSIHYLRKIPFDRIKIDRSLICNILKGAQESHIVQCTIQMASGLAAKVTAEGVENEEQISILRLNGCDELQGYYFHRPMPAASLRQLLDNQRKARASGFASVA